VPTIANRALLVAYAWPENSPRYLRVAKFVREFFGRIDQFHDGARHPKWSEVNLNAEMDGWTRFKPAADWLAEHRSASWAQQQATPPSLKLAFDEFMESYVASTGRRTLSTQEREMLFSRFEKLLQSKPAVQQLR
jgi:hypothetical protein